MRNAEETATIVEQVADSVFEEINERKRLGTYASQQFSGIVYAYCKQYGCTNLFEYILNIIKISN